MRPLISDPAPPPGGVYPPPPPPPGGWVENVIQVAGREGDYCFNVKNWSKIKQNLFKMRSLLKKGKKSTSKVQKRALPLLVLRF